MTPSIITKNMFLLHIVSKIIHRDFFPVHIHFFPLIKVSSQSFIINLINLLNGLMETVPDDTTFVVALPKDQKSRRICIKRYSVFHNDNCLIITHLNLCVYLVVKLLYVYIK